MRRLALLFFPLFLIAGNAFGQECTDQWMVHYDTDPLKPKWFSGDTSAGYAVFSFWGNPRIKYEFVSEFPRARFMSYESQSGQLFTSVDHLFDYAIEPDAGSENPFREGVDMDVPNRSYKVTAVQGAAPGTRNTFRLADGRKTQSIMFRIYSPHEGLELTDADIPRIFAYDRHTGEPAECPRDAHYAVKFYFPQWFASIYTVFNPFEFKLPPETENLGLNKAAGYVYAVGRMRTDQTFLFKFRSPTYADTRPGTGKFPVGSQVRYWSFCHNNFPNNQTLNCVPDWRAKPHSDGYSYIAVGRGKDVEREALARGYTFLPDTRERRQKVAGFVYRNLVPTTEFKERFMYKGEYKPVVLQCDSSDFIAGNCRW